MIWPFRRPAPDLATRISITPPAPSTDQAPLALVLIARNEAAHLRDWLAFHAIAGASHIILYDNGSTDNTAEIARGFPALDVTVVPWVLQGAEHKTGMRLHQQSLAYAHAICTFGSGFERMAFIDTDEFLVPQYAQTLPEVLGQLQHPNISLPWAMFGHSGHDTPPKGAVPFAYLNRAKASQGPLLNFKCIVDPCEVTMVNPHRFETRSCGNQTMNTQGEVATNKGRTGSFVSHDGIQLNHYYLMSEQNMRSKISGPDISGAEQEQRKQAILRKRDLIEADPILDTSAVDFLARHGISTTKGLRDRFAD